MITIDQEVDIFLEHFGAKGMKWGSRKPKSARTETQKSHAKRNRNLKIGGAVLGSAAIAASVLYFRKRGGAHAKIKLSSLKTGSKKVFTEVGNQALTSHIKTIGLFKVDSIDQVSVLQKHAKQIKSPLKESSSSDT